MNAANVGRQHLNAVLTRRAQRDDLMQIEIAWPDSRALLERLAVGLSTYYATDRLLARLDVIVSQAITAYGAAKHARQSDRDRFRAFIAGIAAVLEPDEHRALAMALTHAQRRIIGRQLSVVPAPAGRDTDAG
ncbi:hypothetical protein [uncultured Thiodictyon sp.]|uniref:hypothetical protein n=1 Tax=uncultured Thiodictyon sp. TaxID=1846217 RepID=UPI0025F20536|nr:hypothetical protein [uncultured Thiodictyon sp.]